MALEKEIQYYTEHRSDLVETYKDLFALIQDNVIIGAYPTAEEAYNQGLQQCEFQPFLVKQVVEEEPVIGQTTPLVGSYASS